MKKSPSSAKQDMLAPIAGNKSVIAWRLTESVPSLTKNLSPEEVSDNPAMKTSVMKPFYRFFSACLVPKAGRYQGMNGVSQKKAERGSLCNRIKII
jgi:hypothetical protein